MSFLESPRFPEQLGRGSGGGPGYRTQINETISGREYRDVKWSYPRHRYNAANAVRTHAELEEILAFFHACMGRGYGFRFKDWLDYKSCLLAGTPTAVDQALGGGDGTTLTFQLVKTYTRGALSLVRQIKKPVDGTVLVGVSGVAQPSRWSVDITTGIVTFAANIQKAVTAATPANPVRLTVGSHGLATGDTVYLSGFTGDWAALNGLRKAVAKIDSNIISVPVDGSGFAAYVSGGQIDTVPQAGEAVTAGFEFDVPCRFDTDELEITLELCRHGDVDIPIVETKPF